MAAAMEHLRGGVGLKPPLPGARRTTRIRGGVGRTAAPAHQEAGSPGHDPHLSRAPTPVGRQGLVGHLVGLHMTLFGGTHANNPDRATRRERKGTGR